jgi:hypothetical protein
LRGTSTPKATRHRGRRTEANELEKIKEKYMNTLLRVLALIAAGLASGTALAGKAVPVNATFGIQWTPQNWTGDPQDPANFADGPFTEWETTTLGAVGLPNGKVIAITSTDFLRPAQQSINGEAVLWFSYTDAVFTVYEGSAAFDEQAGTAGYSGPMTVVGGLGRFAGATGSLTIKSHILFWPYAGTLHVKGVIKTAN